MQIERGFRITTKYDTSTHDVIPIPNYPSLSNIDIEGLIKLLNEVGIEIKRNYSRKTINDGNKTILANLDEKNIPGSLKRLSLTGKLEVTIDNYKEEFPSKRIGEPISHEDGIRVFLNYSTEDYKEGSELIERAESAIKKFYEPKIRATLF